MYNAELGKIKNIIEDYEDYCLSIKNFEKEIEAQYKNIAIIHYKNYEKNYLIELNDFEHLKEQINYNLFKTDLNNYRTEMITNFIIIESQNQEVKQEKLKQKVINSIGELYNLLKEGHQYILINEEFGKYFVENKDEENYSYSLNSKELIININEQSLSFKHNKNIINYLCLKNKQSAILKYQGQEFLGDEISIKDEIKDNIEYGTINEIKDYIKDETILNNNENNNNINLEDNFELVLDWYVKYYLEEKKFKTSLANKERISQNKFGFLIEQNEYNKWEKNMNLASLREILKNYINEEEKKEYLSQDEKKQIIQSLKNNNINHKFKIQSLKFKSIDELKSFNRINNLIFISKELFFLINDNKGKNNNENEIQYVIQKKTVDIIISKNKYSFNRYDNLIISYIYYNFYLIIKIYIYQQALNIHKKPSTLYILNKEIFQKYKDCFQYKILKQLMKNNNFDIKDNNEKQIFDFIEKIPDSIVNLIKQNINSFKLDSKLIPTKIVKKNNDIDFAYLYDFDLLFLEGGTFINFLKINEMKKELRKIIKLFFIKEKILIIFEHENKCFGQIGNINNSDEENEFVIDYLIYVKENYTRKFGRISLNDDFFLREEKDINNFYDFIYKTNHEDQFEYKISDKLILYVLNFNQNNKKISLNQQQSYKIIYNNINNISNDKFIQNNNYNNNILFNNQISGNDIYSNKGKNLNRNNPQNYSPSLGQNPFQIQEKQNNNGKILNNNFNEIKMENNAYINNKINNLNNKQTNTHPNFNIINNDTNINKNLNKNPWFSENKNIINNNSSLKQNNINANDTKIVFQPKKEPNIIIKNITKENIIKTSTAKKAKNYDKLINLLLLSINQLKDYTNAQSTNNKGYKVYLINSDLEIFKFSQINYEIKLNSNKISSAIKELNKTNIPNTSKEINKIIAKLNQDKLRQINDEINEIQNISKFQWEPKFETRNLINSKNIKLYKDFLISPENTFFELKKSFDISQELNPVNYIHINGKDIIIFDKILLYGKIDNNKFEIKYIFEFDAESVLMKEKTEIENDVENYIRTKTVFIDNNKKDVVSPIFKSDKTIGNVYKYVLNNDYSKYVDYKKYINNEKLSKFISLCNFSIEIQNNLNKTNNLTEKFYLIKQSAILEFKKICNYDEIKQILDEKNFKLDKNIDYMNNLKQFLKLIKNIPPEILENNFSNNLRLKKLQINEIEPDFITIINPLNVQEYALIYDNFGIIDKKIAELFTEGSRFLHFSYSPYLINDKYSYDCSLSNGKILIDYEKKLGNEKYVCVIGSVDPNYLFINNEYALIYKDYNSSNYQNKYLKYNINKFIQELQLYQGTQPIINSHYEEIGNVIQIKQKIIKPDSIERIVEKIQKENNNNIIVIVSTDDTKDMITIYFESGDQVLKCAVLCKSTDIFNIIVNKVFEREPKFRENFNYFLCGGNRINEYKSMKDNKIKDGDHILLQSLEDN